MKVFFYYLMIVLANCFIYADSTAEQTYLDTICKDVPQFAIQLRGGKIKVYKEYDFKKGCDLYFSDKMLNATLRVIGKDQYELIILSKTVTIDHVWFPYQSEAVVINSDRSDDLLYYPHFFGTIEKGTSQSPHWIGFDYPGHTFAPLIVIADNSDAIVTAAINWPPKRVKPCYFRQQLRFLYYDIIESGEEASYRLLVSRVKGNSNEGVHPWQLAVDLYKDWLSDKMIKEGLWPIDYPEWMKEIDGFLNVQLQNGPRVFKISEIYELWNRWGRIFPWIQFWGEMREALINLPQKKYTPEEFHRMLERRTMHPRYGTDLIEFAKNITNNPDFNDHVGFYVKSRKEKPMLDQNDIVNGETSLEFLKKWFKIISEDFNGNAYYGDMIGNVYLGNPLFVAKLFKTDFPKNMMIEYPVDIYPTSFYVSGSLSAGINRLKWGQKPEHFQQGKDKITFARFGRYLLNSQIIFLGAGNGDYVYWGKENDYWCERQAFLLGAKFEVIVPHEDRDNKNKLNKAIEYSISERKRVGWWKRQPTYLDTKDVSRIPENVEVRRFVDKDEINLFVIDNWFKHKNLKFMFKDAWINIPEKRLAIIEVENILGD